jgi:hypothetical protein
MQGSLDVRYALSTDCWLHCAIIKGIDASVELDMCNSIIVYMHIIWQGQSRTLRNVWKHRIEYKINKVAMLAKCLHKGIEYWYLYPCLHACMLEWF